MHIITKSRIWEAKIKYFDSESALDGWYRVIKRNRFDNFAQLKKTFGSVDKVDNFCVFNIAGNNYRLISAIHYNTQRCYIRTIWTHTEYSKRSNQRKLERGEL